MQPRGRGAEPSDPRRVMLPPTKRFLRNGPRQGQSHRCRFAFTLVEVVLAIGIVAVGVVGLVSLVTTGLQVNREAQNEVLASVISRDIFAKLSAPYAWAPAGELQSVVEPFVGPGQTLQGLAAPDAQPRISNTWFDSSRRIVPEGDPSAVVQVESEIGPAALFLQAPSALAGEGLGASAEASLAQNDKTVWVRLTVKFPRSQNLDQHFATLITQPTS